MTQGGQEVEVGESSKQGKLPDFPDIIEDEGAQKDIGDDRTARLSLPTPTQAHDTQTHNDHQQKTRHNKANIPTGAERVKTPGRSTATRPTCCSCLCSDSEPARAG